MELNEFQERAMTTCTESSANFSYMFLNLVGEVGEYASKVAKAIRKGEIVIARGRGMYFSRECNFEEKILELKKEAGDILWQLSGLCTIMDWSLEEVAEMNLAKLAERKKNGTIVGSGDGVTKEERNA